MKTIGRKSTAFGQARRRVIRSGVMGCRAAIRLVGPRIFTDPEQLRCIWSGAAWHQPRLLDAIHVNSLRNQRAMKSGGGVGTLC